VLRRYRLRLSLEAHKEFVSILQLKLEVIQKPNITNLFSIVKLKLEVIQNLILTKPLLQSQINTGGYSESTFGLLDCGIGICVTIRFSV